MAFLAYYMFQRKLYLLGHMRDQHFFCYKRNSLTIKKLFSRCRSKISHITDVIEECMVRAKFPLYIQECLLSVMEFILHILFKVTQKFH